MRVRGILQEYYRFYDGLKKMEICSCNFHLFLHFLPHNNYMKFYPNIEFILVVFMIPHYYRCSLVILLITPVTMMFNVINSTSMLYKLTPLRNSCI